MKQCIKCSFLVQFFSQTICFFSLFLIKTTHFPSQDRKSLSIFYPIYSPSLKRKNLFKFYLSISENNFAVKPFWIQATNILKLLVKTLTGICTACLSHRDINPVITTDNVSKLKLQKFTLNVRNMMWNM